MLSDEQVVEIRERFRDGAKQVDLAAEYGVSQNTISSLVVGRTRTKAGGPISPGTAQKLTANQVETIRDMAANGAVTSELATHFSVSSQMISNIVSGRAFADLGGPRRPGPWRRGRAPLSASEVAEIKRRFADGVNRDQIATAFGIAVPTIYAIMRDDIQGTPDESGSRFTAEEVAEIRSLYREGISQEEIAATFHTSQQMVSLIVRGLMYGWVPGKVSGNQRRKLTRDQVVGIREAFATGTPIDVLVDRYGATEDVVRHLLQGKTYAAVTGPTFPNLKPPGQVVD